MSILSASHLYKEIHEQPNVLESMLHKEHTTIRALVTQIERRDINYVLIAARGTSDNAGRYANYLLGAFNGLPVGQHLASIPFISARPGSGMLW
jgi:glutamine---fructose-6-phosphate transaminase (isomerizing)